MTDPAQNADTGEGGQQQAPAPDAGAPPAEQTLEKARAMGYQTQEELAANGKQVPYQSPEVFMALKGPLNKIKDYGKRVVAMQRDFDERLNGVNTLHTASLAAQKADLEAKRFKAVEDADIPSFNAAQTQLDGIAQAEAPVAPAETQKQAPLSQDLQDWNAKPENAWILETDNPKSDYAKKQFAVYRGQGLDDANCIQMMEADITRQFPAINHNINGAPSMERGSQPGRQEAPTAPTMQSLTADEARIWKVSPEMWQHDQEKFLKSVADARSEG